MTDRDLVHLDLGIGGMTCDDCVAHVGRALESVPGVEGAQVSLDERSARVTAAEGTDPAALTAAVRAVGYNAFPRGRSDEPEPAR